MSFGGGAVGAGGAVGVGGVGGAGVGAVGGGGLGTEIVRRDEIRLVEDTDGDGYADKATVFAKGFNSIQGLAYHDGTVYVMHAPYLTALRDTKGVGVADERRDLLTGLEDFGKNAGVKAEKLPTEKEAKEIRREIEGLPPIGWMEGMRAMDDAAMVAIRAAQLRQQYRAAIDAGSTWPPNSGISLPLAHGTPLKPEGQN